MFQLLQPIWLFALAGLSIPVIIHLWNQRPGKTLRVGSVALVTANALSHKKSIKLTAFLLLLLRCLLLSCIAVALASPLWRSPENNASKGWVLMSRNDLAAVYHHFKPAVDSLLHTGMEFHYFEEGFAKENIDNALQTVPDALSVKQPSYRSIAALLNTRTGAALPLYIFTDNYLRNFSGIRSAVSLNMHWFTYMADTIHVKRMTDTSVLRITVFSHVHANDARYLKAALDAIQQFSKKNIITKVVTAVADIPQQQDWLFWLADDVYINKTARNILLYAKGKAMPRVSYILPVGNFSFDAIKLYSSIIEKDTTEQFAAVCWKDGFGKPVLTVQQKDNSNYYWLYTHIDPAWNEMPWSDNFPQLLYELIYADTAKDVLATAADKTIIDSSQVMPIVTAEKEAGFKPLVFTETKLAGFFWLLAFILFFAERCLSFYQHKITGNG